MVKIVSYLCFTIDFVTFFVKLVLYCCVFKTSLRRVLTPVLLAYAYKSGFTRGRTAFKEDTKKLLMRNTFQCLN